MRLMSPSLLSFYLLYCLCCQYNHTCLAASINNNVNSEFIDAEKLTQRKARGSRVIAPISQDDAEAHEKYQKEQNDPVQPVVQYEKKADHIEPGPDQREESSYHPSEHGNRNTEHMSEEKIDALFEAMMKHMKTQEFDSEKLDVYCKNHLNSGYPEIADSHSVFESEVNEKSELMSAISIQENKKIFKKTLLDLLHEQGVRKNTEPKVSILEGILVKVVGVFGMVGLIAMALFANKSKRQQQGIPRPDSNLDTCSTDASSFKDAYMYRGDSHENSHLQSTLFLNHEDRDSRNLQSVSSSISNSC